MRCFLGWDLPALGIPFLRISELAGNTSTYLSFNLWVDRKDDVRWVETVPRVSVGLLILELLHPLRQI